VSVLQIVQRWRVRGGYVLALAVLFLAPRLDSSACSFAPTLPAFSTSRRC
jgi:hypothetical protein